jgi:hypothetical protein
MPRHGDSENDFCVYGGERLLGSRKRRCTKEWFHDRFALQGRQTCRRSILLGLCRRVRHENGSVEILECLRAILLAQRQRGGVVLQKPVAGRTCRDLWRWKTDARFLYVADLVEAILLADRIEPAGEVFQIASGKETSIRSLLDAMKVMLPTLKFDVRFAPARPGEIVRKLCEH